MALLDITASHVQQALQEIDKKGINNPHRGLVNGGYELIVNEKKYSPKYVISIAHKYIDGNELDPNTFVSTQANKQLTNIGFTIKRGSYGGNNTTASTEFTWVPFYQEMCSKLLSYTPTELIEILQKLQIDALTDLDAPNGTRFRMIDIDPYTFLSYLNKYGDTKRVQLLGKLKELMNLETPPPTDVHGIPTSQAQRVWLFAYQYKRQPDDISKLREVYEGVQKDALTTELFNKLLNSFGVGKAKITEVLFYQNPLKYLPINSQTTSWLSSRGLPDKYETYEDYLQLLSAVKQHDPRPFYEISREGFVENHKGTPKTSVKYYTVGTTFGDQGDQLTRFIKDGIWENGYGAEKEKLTALITKVPIGSKLAAKASYTEGIGNKISVLEIKAIGTVLENPDDGKTLYVEWDEEFTPYKITGLGSYRSTIQQVSDSTHIKQIFFHAPPQNNTVNTKHANNTILFGPPGTGKTYETIDLAVEIIDGIKSTEHKTNKTRFDKLRKEGQIEFVTFHQNYTYEDFVVGIKPDTDAGNLKFEAGYGVFYKLAEKARTNFIQSKLVASIVNKLPFDEVFTKFIEQLVEKGEEIPVQMASGILFHLTDVSERSIEFRKANGSTTHTLSIATLKRIYEGTQEVKLNGLKAYYKPLSEVLLLRGQNESPAQPKVALKRFVLIIDEINRANISRVFGELITLLEEDKRLGAENELTVTLPNGEPFIVPPNLYLVGTMNTADKSLALLDIALRRRFEFIGKYPDPDVLAGKAKSLMITLNKAILSHKKSADFLIGHAYFIGKQDSQLKSVMDNRVIPLLMEYFNGRTDLVKKVLDEAGIKHTHSELTYQLEYLDDTTN